MSLDLDSPVKDSEVDTDTAAILEEPDQVCLAIKHLCMHGTLKRHKNNIIQDVRSTNLRILSFDEKFEFLFFFTQN